MTTNEEELEIFETPDIEPLPVLRFTKIQDEGENEEDEDENIKEEEKEKEIELEKEEKEQTEKQPNPNIKEEIFDLEKSRKLFEDNEFIFDRNKENKQKETELQGYTDFQIILQNIREKETPIQKYQRLLFEIDSFIGDLSIQKDEKEKKEINFYQMKGSLQTLKDRLEETNLNQKEKLQKSISKETSTSVVPSVQEEIDLLTSLQNKRDEFNSEQENQNQIEKEKEKENQPETENNYNLYFSQISENTTSEMLLRKREYADLDRRATKIEKIVGINPKEFKINKNVEGIKQQINKINQKLGKLNNNEFGIIKDKMTNISEKIEKMEYKINILPIEEENFKRATDIFKTLQQWEEIAGELPKIVLRLRALKVVQNKTVEAFNGIKELNNLQQKFQKGIDKEKMTLNNLKVQYQKDISFIENSIIKLTDDLQSISVLVKK
ncbi:dynactin subunit [Anaeramoeba flamelloides]|uniref:Dynactin subunit n=1 Tax=Anaeramoeba flamelloides TaxID=1746091 RepID=A0AAV7YRD7_9EUKA|nr:dynactin subunit [Anaeramoeba flamelloides]